MVLHHPVAKVKRQKMLKIEITKVRRKLSLDKSSQKAIEQEDPKEKVTKTYKQEKITNVFKKKPKEKEPSPEPEIEEEPDPEPRRLRASGKAESNQADSANESSQNSKKI